jgi:twitching motility protein PilT
MRDPSTINVHELIEIGFHERASDIFIKAHARPMMRQHSNVKPVPGDWPVLDVANSQRMIRELMTEKQAKRFEDHFEMDLAFQVKEYCRVRANLYMQRGTAAGVFRIIPLDILTVDQLGLPPVLKELAKHRVGLILVTGPTGSGKTTTLAAILDQINEQRPCHIVTIEDPLEFVHRDKQSYVLREAPDVILVGEMRDATTFTTSLQAGETGHLVFSTVHTASAYETMDRVINMFPPHEKDHLCQRLANSLRAIVAQKLVPRADGKGRIAANEILICTPTVSKKIEDGHFSDLYELMNDGEFWGMQTMNQSLYKFVKAGIVDEQTALNYAGIQSELKQMLRR